jgi:transposase
MAKCKRSKNAPGNYIESSVSKELRYVSTNDTKSRKSLYQSIVALREEKNMSERAIAAVTHVPKSTVHDILSEWKQKTPVSELKGKGRPKKLNSADRRFVRQFFTANALSTVNDVRNALLESRGKDVSATTVRRTLAELDLRFGSLKWCPFSQTCTKPTE